MELISKSLNDMKADLLVSFSTSKKAKNETTVSLKNTELAKAVNASIEDKTITGKENEAVLFRDKNFHNFRHVLVVGLGDESKITPENFRQAAAAAQAHFKGTQVKKVVVDFDSAPADKKHSAQNMQAFTEGVILADYSYDIKSVKKDAPKKDDSVHVAIVSKHSTKEFKDAVTDGQTLAECVNLARRLGDTPGNLMTPSILAQEAVAAAKGTGIKATIWDKARIQKEKMGGLLGVAQGSAQDPRFIVLEYKGAAKTKKPVVFVGKGLTFDTGGISLKPGAGMEEMKYDMCGGANVIGALIAIAKLKLKVNAIALVPATENMPGSRATKPGDVHFARNGKSFEINNTDAEGRLILSDALCYASELNPELIVDAATLTGAMVVALGNIHTGYFTRNKDLKNTIEKAADTSGELVWHMPLHDHHVKDMKGTWADLSNISSGKGAGSATAAAFLEQFVGEGIPWAHFDIAGTGWAAGNRLNYAPKKGATGCMVRTFVEIAKSV